MTQKITLVVGDGSRNSAHSGSKTYLFLDDKFIKDVTQLKTNLSAGEIESLEAHIIIRDIEILYANEMTEEQLEKYKLPPR